MGGYFVIPYVTGIVVAVIYIYLIITEAISREAKIVLITVGGPIFGFIIGMFFQ